MLSLSWTLEYLPCTYQSRLVLCGRLNPAEHCQVLNLWRKRADLTVYELKATRDLQRVHLLWGGDTQSNFNVAYLICSRVSGLRLLNIRVGFVPYSTTKKIQTILEITKGEKVELSCSKIFKQREFCFCYPRVGKHYIAFNLLASYFGLASLWLDKNSRVTSSTNHKLNQNQPRSDFPLFFKSSDWLIGSSTSLGICFHNIQLKNSSFYHVH